MKLTEPLEQGLLHWKTRLVFPPLASKRPSRACLGRALRQDPQWGNH